MRTTRTPPSGARERLSFTWPFRRGGSGAALFLGLEAETNAERSYARPLMSERNIERRQFIGALAATTALFGCSRPGDVPAAAPEPPAADEWGRVRAEFELSPD